MMTNAVSGPTSPLAGYLTPLQETYLNLAATVVNCDADQRGLVIALKNVVRCLRSLQGFRDTPELGSHIEEFGATLNKLVSWDKLPSHWRSAPQLNATASPYRLWFEKVDEAHGPVEAEKVRAAMGLIFANAFARKEPIADRVAKLCLTLIHSGASERASSKSWREALQALEFLNGSLRQLAEKSTHPPVKEFLSQLLAFLDTHLGPVEVSTQPNPCATDSEPNIASYATSSRAESATKDTPNTSSDDEVATPGNIVAWQAMRARRAGAALVAGLATWNLLEIEDLEPVTRRIDRSLDTVDAPFAILAIVCLITSLPPRIVLSLPLAQNNDMWLSIVLCGICWNRQHITLQEEIDAKVLKHGYQPEQNFFNPLPVRAAKKLGELSSQCANPETLSDILIPTRVEKDEFLRQFGLFLRNDNISHDEHVPYGARFSYSGGEAMFKVTGNQFLAGLLLLDFRHLGFGEAHYICIDQARVWAAFSALYERLGLGEPVSMPT